MPLSIFPFDFLLQHVIISDHNFPELFIEYFDQMWLSKVILIGQLYYKD